MGNCQYYLVMMMMNEKIRYIHGSKDSLDLDVYYVFDKLPSFKECREFCSADESENRNIIVIENGIVTDCFIGVCDEINNGLIDTYFLHEQEYPLLIRKRVGRDHLMKILRSTRGILSFFSRTQYRETVKKALKGNWEDRINAFKSIDFNSIDFNSLSKNYTEKDILKVIAFQIGQTMGLLQGVELYTKEAIAEKFYSLGWFIYRKDTDIKYMLEMLNNFLNFDIYCIPYENIDNKTTYFPSYDRKVDIQHERYI